MNRGLSADLVAGLDIRSATPVSGGDVARAFRLDTPGGPLFLKWHPQPNAGLFQREAAGLRAIKFGGSYGAAALAAMRRYS